jgi:hypothetical protein
MNLDNDVFDLGVRLQRMYPHVPSIAAFFVAAKRGGGVENIMAIDPDGSRLGN